MQPALPLRIVLLAGLWLLISGCSTTSRRPAPAASAAAPQGRGSVVSSRDRAAEADAERVARAHAQFARGILAQDAGSGEQALDWFRQSLEADPSNTALAMDVARAYFARRDLEKAVAVLRGSVSRPGAGPPVRAFYAYLLGQAGRKDDALAVYQALLSESPEDMSLYRSVAALADSPGRVETVGKLLEAGSARPVKDPAYWIGLAEAYAGLSGTNRLSADGRRRQEAVLAKAVALHTTDPQLLQRLGERYAALGDNTQAEAALEQLRQQAPGNPLAAARLAEIYLKEGKSDQARTQLEALARDNPANPLPQYYLALLAMQKRDFEAAVDLLKRVRILKYDFEPAYGDLAAAQLDLRRIQDAVATLDEARQQFGPSFRREYLAGLAAGIQKKYDEAHQHYLAAEAIARTNEPASLDHRFYFQIGATLEQAGRDEESVRYIEKSLSLNPDYDEALNHLGYTWAEKGVNLYRARDMIERALKQDPENPAFLDSMGWVLFKLGKPLDALPHMQKASKLMPVMDATVELHLGDVLEALGRHDEARTAWKRSQSVEDTPEIRKRLEKRP